jgi:hypothetical protein
LRSSRFASRSLSSNENARGRAPLLRSIVLDDPSAFLVPRSEVLFIVKPETIVGWHRTGFRLYWRWRSRPRGGRPQINREVRDLIKRMAVENPAWGAPRIHGEIQNYVDYYHHDRIHDALRGTLGEKLPPRVLATDTSCTCRSFRS